MPFFSIILPTYNSEQTLLKALESVAEQTFKDFEVLIMDGGSTDRTSQIVEEWQGNDPRFHFHQEADTGVYNAMNKGILLAKGKYLYFMGSDDYFAEKNVLETVANKIENVDFFYGNVRFVHSGEIYSGESSLEKLVYKRISICHQSIFYSKKVFDILGGYNEKYFIHADHDYNIKCFEEDSIRKKYDDMVIAVFNEQGLSGKESNKDGYKDVITERIFANDKELLKIKREKENLERQVIELKTSKSYKIGRAIVGPFSFLINKFKKRS